MSTSRAESRGSRAPAVLAFAATVATLLVCVALGWLVEQSAGSGRIALFVLSVAIVLVVVSLGRGDLSRPEILLPAVWYSGVGLAQLRLLAGYESPWSNTMIIVALTAPIAFSLGSVIAGGGISRPRRQLSMQAVDSRRLRTASIFLLGLGALGLVLKVRLTGGIALFSNEIDELRSAGGIHVPAWVTMLTDCLFLSFWSAVLCLRTRTTQAERTLDAFVAACGFIGVALGASRNTLLIAILVPLIFLYLARDRSKIGRGRLFALVTVFAIVAVVISGLFFVRTGQHKQSRFESNFYSYVVPRTPVVARPLLPVYISLAAPLETLNRTIRRAAAAPSNVTYSAPGIPPQVTPFGPRGDFYAFTGVISRPYYFNVATFAGPLYLDGGIPLVLGIALLLGLAAGAVRRWALGRPTILSLAILAYVTYLVGFLVYENILAVFTLSVVFDLLAIWIVLSWCSSDRESHWADNPSHPS